jgi:hypothetical protein
MTELLNASEKILMSAYSFLVNLQRPLIRTRGTRCIAAKLSAQSYAPYNLIQIYLLDGWEDSVTLVPNPHSTISFEDGDLDTLPK